MNGLFYLSAFVILQGLEEKEMTKINSSNHAKFLP